MVSLEMQCNTRPHEISISQTSYLVTGMKFAFGESLHMQTYQQMTSYCPVRSQQTIPIMLSQQYTYDIVVHTDIECSINTISYNVDSAWTNSNPSGHNCSGKVSVEKSSANIAVTQPIPDSGCPVPNIGHIF